MYFKKLQFKILIFNGTGGSYAESCSLIIKVESIKSERICEVTLRK